jgi:hypothetical protein
MEDRADAEPPLASQSIDRPTVTPVAGLLLTWC